MVNSSSNSYSKGNLDVLNISSPSKTNSKRFIMKLGAEGFIAYDRNKKDNLILLVLKFPEAQSMKIIFNLFFIFILPTTLFAASKVSIELPAQKKEIKRKISSFEKSPYTEKILSFNNSKSEKNFPSRRRCKREFKSLIIDKDFEPENPKQLEELDENSCKWPIGHPNEKSFYFCGRSSLKDFSYCKLHLLYAYQPKGKKEEVAEKDEVAEFIEKKIQSA